MKKLSILMIALISAFVMAGTSFADDRLEMSGQFYVRAWSHDNVGYVDNNDDDYIRQKFLLGIKANIADDVYAKLRADYGEAKWGYDYSRGAVAKAGYYQNGLAGVTRDNTQINLERAYINIDKEMWSLRLGQQFLALGIMEVFDGNPTAAKLGLKLNPVNLSLIYAKLDEGTSVKDDLDSEEDTDLYAFNVSYDQGAYSADFFAVMTTDDSDNDDSPYGIGLNVKTTLGMVNLNTELAYLGGDTNDGDTDYYGLQFYLGADAQITDMIKIGTDFLWADASDDDEIQLTNLGNWDDFTPMSANLPIATYVTAMPNWNSPFDLSGDSAGVLGITLFADFNICDGLKAGTKVGYFEPEDDGKTDLDSVTSWNLYAIYRIATNTDISLTYFASSPDFDSNADDETEQTLCAMLELNF